MKGLLAAGAAWWLRKSENRDKAKHKGQEAWENVTDQDEERNDPRSDAPRRR